MSSPFPAQPEQRMNRTPMLQIRLFALGLTLLCVVHVASAQQQSDIEAVMLANAAFDAAIAQRDIKAMATLWAQDEKVVALHPSAKQFQIGWDAVRKSWEGAFDRFAELHVQMHQPVVRVQDGTAWVSGVEAVKGKRKNGDLVSYSAFTSNVFEKKDGRWLMTLHYTSVVPKE